MWNLIVNKVKSLQGNPSPGVLSTQEREMTARGNVYEVVNKHFGVHIEPSYDAGVCRYSMTLMPDEAIEEVAPENRESFVIGVHHMSLYIYQTLDIENLLLSFMGKPFDRRTQHELEGIIEDLMIMHERVMEMKFVDFQTDVIMNIIDGKMFV